RAPAGGDPACMDGGLQGWAGVAATAPPLDAERTLGPRGAPAVPYGMDLAWTAPTGLEWPGCKISAPAVSHQPAAPGTPADNWPTPTSAAPPRPGALRRAADALLSIAHRRIGEEWADTPSGRLRPGAYLPLVGVRVAGPWPPCARRHCKTGR